MAGLLRAPSITDRLLLVLGGKEAQAEPGAGGNLLRVSPLPGAQRGAGGRVAAMSFHHPDLHHRTELRGPGDAGHRNLRQAGRARAW